MTESDGRDMRAKEIETEWGEEAPSEHRFRVRLWWTSDAE